ncbi:hypothetical protein [Streptomyces sp. NPDC048442]|uniref:hypothetical protein n=1 Tax=Streptomyces sp. NPDC048442 TaxID=3154823 RepID=UPI0034340559
MRHMTRICSTETVCAAALLLPLLAGCGSDRENKGGSTATPSRTASTASPSRTHTPDREPTSKPPKPFPRAADGTRTDACSDADCEIEVTGPTTLDFPAGHSVRRFTITRISEDTLHWTSVFPGESESFTSGSVGAQGTVTLNDLHIETRAIQGKHAVIRVFE